MAQVQRLYNFANGTRSDAEQVDAELDNLIQGVNTLDNDLNTHKSSGDHDDRYYTKSQTDTQINNAVANIQASKFVETGTMFPSNPTKGQTFYHETEEQFYIYDGSEWAAQKTNLSALQKEVANLNLQLEANQRVTNGKTFGTDFLNTFGMTIDFTKTKSVGALSIGQTQIIVESVTGFAVGQEVTIYDDVNLERVTISAIDTTNKILTVAALTKSFKDKANVARTMAVADTVNKCLKFGGWLTQTTNTVTDATVVASAYDTSGNGGRKLVRLENDWLVACEKDTTNDVVYFQVDKQDGEGFKPLCYSNIGSSNTLVDVALEKKGTRVFALISWNLSNTQHRISFISFDVVVQANVDIGLGSVIESSTLQGGNCSIVINEAGTELHATWSNRVSTYSNSNNIRYAKGTINADGSVTWGAVEQRTTYNASTTTGALNPTITMSGSGNPVIIFALEDNQNSARAIACRYYNGTTWNASAVYSLVSTSLTQSSPSAIFVPQSVNGLPNGLLGNAWHGTDSTSGGVNYIRFSRSTDGGANWSTPQKLVPGTNPTLTTNKNGKLFITYEDNGVTKRIESTDNGDTWSAPITVGNGTNPSSLFDLSLNMSEPLTIRKGASSVLFSGTWTIGTETPILENDVRFTVQDTDEIALWVQRDELAGFTINAEVNGNTMTKTSVTGEDQFTYDLGNVQPTELKLKLTRSSTSDDVKITKILGGVA
jgi:hypothetical protein